MVYVPSSQRTPDLVGVMLLKTGATSEKTAVPLANLDGCERKQLARLIRRGVVFESRTPGHYWVDREKLAARAQTRTRFAVAVVILTIIVMVVVVLYAK